MKRWWGPLCTRPTR